MTQEHTPSIPEKRNPHADIGGLTRGDAEKTRRLLADARAMAEQLGEMAVVGDDDKTRKIAGLRAKTEELLAASEIPTDASGKVDDEKVLNCEKDKFILKGWGRVTGTRLEPRYTPNISLVHSDEARAKFLRLCDEEATKRHAAYEFARISNDIITAEELLASETVDPNTVGDLAEMRDHRDELLSWAIEKGFATGDQAEVE